MGKSIWCSSASRSRKSSSTSWTTSSMRASGRSTLLTTSTTGSRASRALRSTNRVWGRGPSEASTSSRTPSTMVRPRSTSPPKSACPGVSMMLILTPLWRTAVFLARMVMPFSRSRSPESMTRSLTDWLSRNAPDCQSMASTRVVLPWSTWATMATLRMSSRVCGGMRGEGYPPSRPRSDPADAGTSRGVGADPRGRSGLRRRGAGSPCPPCRSDRPAIGQLSAVGRRGGLGRRTAGLGARCSSRPTSRGSTTACPGSGSRAGE